MTCDMCQHDGTTPPHPVTWRGKKRHYCDMHRAYFLRLAAMRPLFLMGRPAPERFTAFERVEPDTLNHALAGAATTTP